MVIREHATVSGDVSSETSNLRSWVKPRTRIYCGVWALATKSTMIQRAFHIPKHRLAAFCRHHRIRKLALFGSALRADFGPDSDIDVLVEFEPAAEVGLIRLAGMELELAELLGTERRVDLRTPEDLSRRFRDAVMQSAEVQYAA